MTSLRWTVPVVCLLSCGAGTKGGAEGGAAAGNTGSATTTGDDSGGGAGGGTGGGTGDDTASGPDGEWALISGIYGSQYAEGVAVDGAGDVWFGGSFVNGIDLGDGGYASFGGDDILVGRVHGGDGSLAWNAAVRTDGSDVAYDVALSPDGALYVAGWFEGELDLPGTTFTSKGEDDGFLARWESDGSFAWGLQLGGSGDDRMRSVDADASGACVAGFSTNGITGTGLPLGGVSLLDGVVVCVDPSGVPTWGTVLGFGSGTAPALAVALSDTGIHAGGYFTGELDLGAGRVASEGGRDAWWMRWPREGGAGAGLAIGATGDQEVRGLVGQGGDVFAVGIWSGGDTPLEAQTPQGASDGFLARVREPSLRPALASLLLIGGPGVDEALDIAASPSGELAVVGTSDDALPLAEEHPPLGDFDMWAGVWSEGWTRSVRVGGPGEDKARAVAWHPSGDLILGGTSYGSMTVGETTLEGYGDRDFVLARISP